MINDSQGTKVEYFQSYLVTMFLNAEVIHNYSNCFISNYLALSMLDLFGNPSLSVTDGNGKQKMTWKDRIAQTITEK